MKFSKARLATYWLIFLLGLLLVFAGACSTTPEAEAELVDKLWREQIDRENWELCVLAYSNSGRFMLFDHAHKDNESILEIRWDLGRNMCKSALGKHWIDY